MDTSSSPLPEETRAAARALIEQRATLEEWLARLSEKSQSVPAHVADRVRGDYAERLRRVTEELGAHQGAIRQDVEALRDRLAEAEARSADATDRLEELRLRHLIGEVDDAAWDEQRPPLEAEVEQAEAVRGSLGAELEQIGTLLSEVEAAGSHRAAGDVEEDPWAEGAAPAAPAADEAPEPADAVAGYPRGDAPGAAAADVPAAGTDAHAGSDSADGTSALGDEGWSPMQDDSYTPAAADEDVSGDVTDLATVEAETGWSGAAAGAEDERGADEDHSSDADPEALEQDEPGAAESPADEQAEGEGERGDEPEDSVGEPVTEIDALVSGAAPGDEDEDGTVDSSGWLTDEDEWGADLPALGASAAPASPAPGAETPQRPVIMDSDEGGDDSLGWLDEVVPPAKKETAEAFDDLDFLRSIAGEDAVGGAPEGTAQDAEPAADESAAADDDLAFLSDLDQSIASGREGPNVGGDVTKKTIDCRDCGSVNDARAWYCEVCGGELS